MGWEHGRTLEEGRSRHRHMNWRNTRGRVFPEVCDCICEPNCDH